MTALDDGNARALNKIDAMISRLRGGEIRRPFVERRSGKVVAFHWLDCFQPARLEVANPEQLTLHLMDWTIGPLTTELQRKLLELKRVLEAPLGSA